MAVAYRNHPGVYKIDELVHGHTHKPGVWDLELSWVMHKNRKHIHVECVSKDAPWLQQKEWLIPGNMQQHLLPLTLRVVDTGGFPHASHDHPLGWYKKGEVAPMAWHPGRQTLYRVSPSNLKEVWVDGKAIVD